MLNHAAACPQPQCQALVTKEKLVKSGRWQESNKGYLVFCNPGQLILKKNKMKRFCSFMPIIHAPTNKLYRYLISKFLIRVSSLFAKNDREPHEN